MTMYLTVLPWLPGSIQAVWSIWCEMTERAALEATLGEGTLYL